MKIFNNSTLIFTAHNPYIFEVLRKDAIYFINNKSNFIRYKDEKINGLPVRSDFKFSKNYFEEKIGSFPDKDNFKHFCEQIVK